MYVQNQLKVNKCHHPNIWMLEFESFYDYVDGITAKQIKTQFNLFFSFEHTYSILLIIHLF